MTHNQQEILSGFQPASIDGIGGLDSEGGGLFTKGSALVCSGEVESSLGVSPISSCSVNQTVSMEHSDTVVGTGSFPTINDSAITFPLIQSGALTCRPLDISGGSSCSSNSSLYMSPMSNMSCNLSRHGSRTSLPPLSGPIAGPSGTSTGASRHCSTLSTSVSRCPSGLTKAGACGSSFSGIRTSTPEKTVSSPVAKKKRTHKLPALGATTGNVAHPRAQSKPDLDALRAEFLVKKITLLDLQIEQLRMQLEKSRLSDS